MAVSSGGCAEAERGAGGTTPSAKREGGDDSSELDGWAWHDFRRSFATPLGESGVSETIADAVLNHHRPAVRDGVLGVYQRASGWPEQVKAMKLWERLLAAAIEGCDADAKARPMTVGRG